MPDRPGPSNVESGRDLAGRADQPQPQLDLRDIGPAPSTGGPASSPRTGTAARWLFVSGVSRSASQLVLLILVARFLGPTAAGSYSLGLAITIPIFIVAELGMRTIYLTIHAGPSFRQFSFVRLISLGIAVLVAGGISVFMSRDVELVVLSLALVKAVDSYADLCVAALQQAGCFRQIAISTIGNGVLTLLATGVALAFSGTVVEAILLSFAVSLGVVIGYLVPLVRAAEATGPGQALPDRVAHRVILRAGIPAGLAMGLITLLTAIPPYFLSAVRDHAVVARYSVLVYAFLAVEIWLSAAVQAWIPVGRAMYVAYSRSVLLKAAGRRAVIGGAWLLLPILALTVFGNGLIRAVFGTGFGLSPSEVWPLALGIVLLPAVFYSAMVLLIANQYGRTFVVSCVSVAVVLVGCFLFAGPMGVVGCLWANAAAAITRVVLSVFCARRGGGAIRPRTDALIPEPRVAG